MSKPLIFIILVVICFFLPLHVFVIGNGLGIGIQGAFYRYQETVYGNSFIPLPHEVNYVITGLYTGSEAVSVIFWVTGGLFLIISMILLFKTIRFPELPVRSTGIILIIAGIFFIFSCASRYGPTFSNPAGLSIPAGYLWILILGFYLIYAERGGGKNTID
jgi:hypothetical protein